MNIINNLGRNQVSSWLAYTSKRTEIVCVWISEAECYANNCSDIYVDLVLPKDLSITHREEHLILNKQYHFSNVEEI